MLTLVLFLSNFEEGKLIINLKPKAYEWMDIIDNCLDCGRISSFGQIFDYCSAS